MTVTYFEPPVYVGINDLYPFSGSGDILKTKLEGVVFHCQCELTAFALLSFIKSLFSSSSCFVIIML